MAKKAKSKNKNKNKIPTVCSYSRSMIYHCEYMDCPYHILNLPADAEDYYLKHHCQLNCKKFDGE